MADRGAELLPTPGCVILEGRGWTHGVGKRSLPNNMRMKLELLDERCFGNAMVYLYYRTRT